MVERNSDKKIELFDRDNIDEYPIFDPDGDDKKLFDAIRNDKLIIFYGAGVSMIAGCAGWTELARNIINKFPREIYSELDKQMLQELATNDPKKAISICYHRAKKDKNHLENVYFKAIRDSVIPRNVEEFVGIHKRIFDLDAISYVTTNIDKGIETINNIDLKRKRIIDLTNSDLALNPMEEIKNSNVFYLHGTIDNIERTIFTVDSYFKFYSDPTSNIITFLREIFRGKYSVLFIGYSLNEYEILQNVFLTVRNLDREVDIYNHYLLAPIYSKDLAKFNIEKEYFRIFSIKAIPYFIDYEGYSRLKHVLDKLRITIREYRPDILSVFNEIDKV